MSKTKGDCKALFLRYLDEATKKGVDLPAEKNADYVDKFNYFLDYANKYVAGIVRLPSVYSITHNPIEPLYGNYEMTQYLPGDTKVVTATGAKSYTFEADNPGTATIAINGTDDTVITITASGSFSAYSGDITANDSDVVTITFTGTYPFNYRNVALYWHAFPSASVPAYSPFIFYDMPDDFMAFDLMAIQTNPDVYAAYTDYKWDKIKRIAFGRDMAGAYDICYFRYPASLDPTDGDSTEIDAEDKAIPLVVLQAAINATAADNLTLSSWLRSLFGEMVQNVSNDEKLFQNSVQTIYYM